MNVFVADAFETSGLEAIRALGCTVTYEPSLGTERLGAALARGGIDVLIVRSTKVPGAAINGAVGLRAIVRAGAGVDNIDVAAASARGIGVCNCPGMNAIAVAELTMGLLIACDRRIADQTGAIKAGRWDKKEFTKNARGLKGSSLVLIGYGAIGQAVAKRAQAFEMNVAAWATNVTPALARSHGIQYIGTAKSDLIAALPKFDAVSIHMALSPDTAKFCNGEFFNALQPGTIFINTSRGGVVDEAAMVAAAQAKGLRLGLDVYENQPANSPAEIKTQAALVPGSALTHHCGASTDQAQDAVSEEVVRILRVFKDTGTLENSVNEVAQPVLTPWPSGKPRSGVK